MKWRGLSWPQSLLLLILAGCTAHGADTPSAPAGSYGNPHLITLLKDRDLDEISGLAASRRTTGVFWLHNDHPSKPLLHAVDATGRRRGSVQVDAAKAIDWEDIASYTLDGKHWLLIGDIGDNGGVRDEYELIAIEEPAIPAAGEVVSVKPAWRLRFRYPDAPHDCESLAVDVASRSILLLTKRTRVPTLYSLPLGPAGEGLQIAALLHEVDSIPPASHAERSARYPAARYAGHPTGMDIDVAGRRAIVLTYRNAWLFTRSPRQTWGEAFASTPQQIPLPPLAQAEAIGFDHEGKSFFVSGERLPAPWIRFDPIPSPSH